MLVGATLGQGAQPGGVTAAKAIERLQQQTNGRFRLKTNSLALYSIPREAKLIASRNAKYWTTERLMRVTDNSTGQVNLIKFDPEQIFAAVHFERVGHIFSR